MKRLVALGLILVILLPMFSRLAIIGHFNTHRADIIQTLCENKARPELQCQGSCQLRKRLASVTHEIRQRPAQAPPALRLTFGDLVDTLEAPSDGLATAILPAKCFSPRLMPILLAGYARRSDRPPQARACSSAKPPAWPT